MSRPKSFAVVFSCVLVAVAGSGAGCTGGVGNGPRVGADGEGFGVQGSAGLTGAAGDAASGTQPVSAAGTLSSPAAGAATSLAGSAPTAGASTAGASTAGAGPVAGTSNGASGVGPAAGTSGASAACDPELSDCSGECVSLSTDSLHCGSCSNACGTGEVCTAGVCACSGTLTDCGDGCTDTLSDPAHCGSCGMACTAPQVCSGGQCSSTCDATLTQCGQQCVDTQSDRQNCGGCGTVCSADQACNGGSCGCAGALELCGSACVDTQSDAANCGMCNSACPEGTSCQGGTCECPGGLGLCSGSCIDTQGDVENCGSCGNACGPQDSCDGGMCIGPRCGDTPWPEYNGNGSVTWYRFDQGTAAAGNVNCRFGIQQNPDRVNHIAEPELFGAMNTSDYQAAAVCGACVEITRNDTGARVTVTIVDQCPQSSNPVCTAGHVDLSTTAFQRLGDLNSEGHLGDGTGSISWQYVPCNVGGNLRYILDGGSNSYYMAVTVANHENPISKVELLMDGTFVAMNRAEYNVWIMDAPVGAGPYTYRVTDIHGNIIQDKDLALSPGQTVEGGRQFPVCP